MRVRRERKARTSGRRMPPSQASERSLCYALALFFFVVCLVLVLFGVVVGVDVVQPKFFVLLKAALVFLLDKLNMCSTLGVSNERDGE